MALYNPLTFSNAKGRDGRLSLPESLGEIQKQRRELCFFLSFLGRAKIHGKKKGFFWGGWLVSLVGLCFFLLS